MESTVEMSAQLAARLEDWLVAQNGHLSDDDRQSRRAALEAFEALGGVPGKNHEEWKYTDVRHWASYLPMLEGRDVGGNRFLPDWDVNRLVFVNGQFDEAASSIQDQEGLFIGTLAEARAQHPERFAGLFGSLVDTEDRAFAAVNAAFHAENSLCVLVDRNVQAEKTILIEEHAVGLDTDGMIVPRHFVLAEQSSHVRIVRRQVSQGNLRAVSQSEVLVRANARVDWVEVQERRAAGAEYRSIDMMDAVVSRDARFEFRVFGLGGDLVRNDTQVRFSEGPAEADLRGFYHVADGDLIDYHLLIDHAMPNCHSNQLYKGILDGDGKGVFNGKIFVKQDAQKTEAYQSNKNLLLSQDAVMNSKPQLEIFADDVRCSHGATSGQLDQEALFYLRARGLSPDSARSLLLRAFAGELLEGMPEDPLFSYLEDRIADRLAG